MGKNAEEGAMGDNNALIRELIAKQDEKHYEQLKGILNGSNQQVTISKIGTYELMYANDTALRSFDKEGEDYRGKVCYEFFMNYSEPCSFCPIKDMPEGGNECRTETVNGDRVFDVFVKKAVLNDVPVYVEYVSDITEARTDLQNSNEYLDIVNDLANSGMWYFHFNKDGTPGKVVWNNQFRHILGYTDENDFPNKGEYFINSIYEEDRPMVAQAVLDALKLIKEYDIKYRVVKKDGTIRWVYAHGKCVRYDTGEPRLLLGTLVDITEQRKEEELNLIIAGLAKDYTNVYLVDLDNETISPKKENGSFGVSDIFSEEEGNFSFETVWRKYVDTCVNVADREDIYQKGCFETVRQKMEESSEYSFNYMSINKGIRHFQIKFTRLDENRIISSFRNIDDIVKLYEKSEVLGKVERDSLTKLYNKESFLEYSQRMLDRFPEDVFDMVCIEIESYALLVGRYGTDNCDSFVYTLGDVLRRYENEDTVIGRIDDDQFALFRRHLSEEDYYQKYSELYSLFRSETTIPNIKINCGIYSKVDHSINISAIIKNAQLPLEGLRKQYELNVAFFDDEIRARLDREELIGSAAADGIAKNEFKVYYQPKHDAFTEKVKGAEALVRWIHPELGFISPGDFIPIFEKNGFITTLDKYIVEQVCIDLRSMLDSDQVVVPVSINVSQVDFDLVDLPDIFEAIVDKYKIPHRLIHFEVTESANARDNLLKADAIVMFKFKNFKVELDDFGAGYSNLSSLGELPLDVMKIDISLIRNMHHRKHLTILRTIMMGARGLGLVAVAEGVETAEQLGMLRGMADGNIELLIQGYYYSKPLPFNDFKEYLTARN